MQLGNFIDMFLARHVSCTYAHHQELYMLSCSIWFSAPSFWMGGGLESRCVGRVNGADGAAHLMLLMMGVCTRSMSSKEYINKITLLNQVGIPLYFNSEKYRYDFFTSLSVLFSLSCSMYFTYSLQSALIVGSLNTGLFKMIVGVLTTCYTQYTLDRNTCLFYLIEQHSKLLLHTVHVLYMCTHSDSTNINTIIEFVPNCM